MSFDARITKPDFPSLAGSGQMAPLPPGLVELPNWLGARYFGLAVRRTIWAIRAKLTADRECADARSRDPNVSVDATRRSWRYHRRVPRGAAYGPLRHHGGGQHGCGDLRPTEVQASFDFSIEFEKPTAVGFPTEVKR
jgi:hypothetical protein